MSNIFNGVPIDTHSAVSLTGNLIMFIKDYKYYIHNISANTTDAGVDFGAGTSILTQIPTGFVSWMTFRKSFRDAINLLYSNGMGYQYTFTISNNIPTFTFASSFTQSAAVGGTGSYSIGLPATGEIDTGGFNTEGNQWYKWNGTSTNASGNPRLSAVTYGGVGQPLEGLPSDLGSSYVNISNPTTGYAFKGDYYYELSFTNGSSSYINSNTDLGRIITGATLVSSGTLPSAVPPTPLPDIEVVYSAPSQFNLFASDVTLVTETPLGWNFTKTINDANKMELYLYQSTNTGAVQFNYNQLRDIKVNMKNNLLLPAGEIFVTVYTGPATAPNWYNYKDTYNLTPALGATIDVSLVEHISNLTDTRTDPILAIALHSNSAQQQVNCDVERVSFEILLPATNNTQRLIVKLQNNFVAIDNHYWDLDDTATARLNTTIIPAFDIHSFSPNIVGGNYPQNVTALESSSGCALFVPGTWQLWETADGTTWTATPNATITLIPQTSVSPIPPGPSANGFAYIGTTGVFNNFGTGLPLSNRPITWDVTTSNQLEMTWTGSSTALFAPLGNMTTSNNFTAAQKASGFFDTNATAGSTAVRVFISSATSPSGDPVASRDIDIVVKSETEISIKRSWELSVTTYTINVNDPKEITGQYTDPVYTTSVAPTSFSMPTNWLKTADNTEHFEILFSGGLNNSLPAESQNFRQMTVTPTPSNTQLTFTWVANYYTAGNILISPVLGIGTSGLVSGFTTGGSLKPANAAYILYGCTSSDNIDAFTSLVFIEPTAAESFNLTFSGGLNNQISADGTYSVAPYPVDATSTYAYTAVFRDVSGASLGAVPNAGASGASSSFTIAYASLPANVAYIDYNATATGGGQDGEVAQLSITIIPAVVPPPPPPPPSGNDDLELIRSTTGSIIFNQYNSEDSLKKLTGDRLTGLTMTLTDSYGDTMYSPAPVYYELHIKSSNSG